MVDTSMNSDGQTIVTYPHDVEEYTRTQYNNIILEPTIIY